ncbi:thiol-disulfide oxidoreductase DCC family protein [Cerasicoccus maritimus]|uniref:thiol-disulfide oxidoreductase DCC family protein n=1 Tax=Cerasicoccus maritimus TaxID=490089 RepID=UPI0028525148|nr:DCC1-like thiol-disulfide oxidoreductase family protein [Cerasicoccus maritimus]
MAGLPIDQLTVLTDGECQLCLRARRWLEGQEQFVPLRFVPIQTTGLPVRYPGIEALDLKKELTVIGPERFYWQGVDAWLMTLWALEDWRERAIELSQPLWRPLARRLIIELSQNRFWLSAMIASGNEERLRDALIDEPPDCTDGSCELPPPLPKQQRNETSDEERKRRMEARWSDRAV